MEFFKEPVSGPDYKYGFRNLLRGRIVVPSSNPGAEGTGFTGESVAQPPEAGFKPGTGCGSFVQGLYGERRQSPLQRGDGLIVRANWNVYKEENQMCDALKELFDELYGEKIEKQIQIEKNNDQGRRKAEGKAEGRAEGKAEGKGRRERARQEKRKARL